MKALVVLALVFLLFSHQTAAFPKLLVDGPAVSVTDLSLCSQGHDSATSNHPSCHACQVSPADLPLPPCEVLPAFAVDDVDYRPLRLSNLVTQPNDLLPETRAPPAHV
jgi:hypothetical protein|tara:strand:+ start:2165 stop:2488 length:324 start_codon:yes stop_codon:yes gene_type:complete